MMPGQVYTYIMRFIYSEMTGITYLLMPTPVQFCLVLPHRSVLVLVLPHQSERNLHTSEVSKKPLKSWMTCVKNVIYS